MEDLDLRATIYRRIVDTGAPPSRADVISLVGSADFWQLQG